MSLATPMAYGFGPDEAVLFEKEYPWKLICWAAGGAMNLWFWFSLNICSWQPQHILPKNYANHIVDAKLEYNRATITTSFGVAQLAAGRISLCAYRFRADNAPLSILKTPGKTVISFLGQFIFFIGTTTGEWVDVTIAAECSQRPLQFKYRSSL